MRPCLSCLLAVTLLGCGDGDGATDDAGEDAAAAVCESVPDPIATGHPDGHPSPLGAEPGEARAGRLAATDLPVHEADLFTNREGDFVLANDRIAIIIEAARPSDGYNPFGGEISGVARVADGRLLEPGDFNEVIVSLGIHTVAPDTVTVLADGRDGGPAIIRSAGTMRAIPFLGAFLGTGLSGRFDDAPAAIDYVLEPDATTVELRLVVDNPNVFPLTVSQALHLFMQASRMPNFAPDVGFDIARVDEPRPWIGFIDDEATSYGWRERSGPLTFTLEVSGASVYLGRSFRIPGCDRLERSHVRMDVGGPGLDGLVTAVAAADGDPLAEMTGTVVESDGSPAVGVRVHATLPDGRYLTRARTDETGAFSLHVPGGENVELTYYRRGEPLVGPVAVAAGAAPDPLTLAAGGDIEVTATDAVTSEPLPVRVQVVPDGGPPSLPASFGESLPRDGRLHVEFPIGGTTTLPVWPGRHRVIVSRGFEYELHTEEVDVAADAVVPITAVLDRVVDTTGVMCGDFHIHTHRSLDSPDTGRIKLASAVGDGLEIPVRTDHEWVRDFEPEVAEMGLEGWAFGVGGMELTTFSWGHFNVFPLEPQPDAVNDGAFDWAGRLPPAVFGDVRERRGSDGEAALIINHPRGSNFGGYFSAAGYDPVTGMVERPDHWDEEFTLVEVFNDDDFDDSSTEVTDWFSFLNQGRRVFAIGSSDSHRIRSSPVGYPRTCIDVGTDDPIMLRSMGPGHVRDRVNAGAVTISGGIYLTALARGDVGPGGEVRSAADIEMVAVTVRAASWVDVVQLRVYVDGELVETLPLDDTTMDPLDATIRFRGDVAVPVAGGPVPSWVVLVADGEMPLDPVHPRRNAFGVTNPIFFRR